MIFNYQQKRAQTKAEQIFKGALSQFLEFGYVGASMDKIAQASGVSKQTLYSHFGDKESLFKALIKQVATQEFQLVWAKPLQGKPEFVLRELAQRIIQEISDSQYLAFVHIIVTEAKNQPELTQIFLENVCKPAMATLTNYLSNCDNLQLDDPEAIAVIFVYTLIHYVITQEILGGKIVIPISPERVIDNLIKIIVKI